MSKNTERLRGHVASYKSLSSHRQNCLDVCDEVDALTTENEALKNDSVKDELTIEELTAEVTRLEAIEAAVKDIFHYYILSEDSVPPEQWDKLGNLVVTADSGSQVRDASCLDAGCDIDGKEPHKPHCDHAKSDQT